MADAAITSGIAGWPERAELIAAESLNTKAAIQAAFVLSDHEREVGRFAGASNHLVKTKDCCGLRPPFRLMADAAITSGIAGWPERAELIAAESLNTKAAIQAAFVLSDHEREVGRFAGASNHK